MVTASPRRARQVHQLMDRTEFLSKIKENRQVPYTELLLAAEKEMFRISA